MIYENTYVTTKKQFEQIINDAFVAGALAHSNRSGQSDTCWSNVHEDSKEYIEMVVTQNSLNDLQS